MAAAEVTEKSNFWVECNPSDLVLSSVDEGLHFDAHCSSRHPK
jgi:hypothetical protein